MQTEGVNKASLERRNYQKRVSFRINKEREMKKEYKDIKGLIKARLKNDEDKETRDLINKLKDVIHRGYFTGEEFLKMGTWKSPRPKKWYEANSEKDIKKISKNVFSTDFERRRVELLTKLKGVSIPTASAILMLTNPQIYGVIDIRVWQVLHTYGSVKVNPTGTNFSFNNWYNYLMKIRYFAESFNATVRDIERTIFYYHREKYEGKLYKDLVNK
jgi:hypothetical protein